MRIGTALIVVGLGLAFVGAIVRFAPGLVSWFGKLPGDVRIQTESTRVFIPITSMVIVSLVVSLVVGIINRFR